MRDGLRILDADRHVIEPIEMWRTYLPPHLRARAPTFSPVLSVDGRPAMRKYSVAAQAEVAIASVARHEEMRAASHPAGQLHYMDRSGIDVAFLIPTFAMYLVANDEVDTELSIAFARAYNDWMRDFCSVAPERLCGLGLVSRHDPSAMTAEVERFAEFGFRGVVVRPNPILGRVLGDPAHEGFWATCARLDMAVVVHEGTHAVLASAGADRFESRFALHACSHPMEQMMAFLTLLEGGVLERHPTLRFAFLEAGCGWLPYWLHRLDHTEFQHLAREVAGRVTQSPSAYFRRQCFIGFEPEESYLPDLVGHLDRGRPLVFGSDFPHPDHEFDIVTETFALKTRLPADVFHGLLWDNGARLYGLR